MECFWNAISLIDELLRRRIIINWILLVSPAFFSLFDLKLFWSSFYVKYYVFISVICVFSISQHDCSLIIRQCSNGIYVKFWLIISVSLKSH